jgi:COP9 signalosome complex subunit 4
MASISRQPRVCGANPLRLFSAPTAEIGHSTSRIMDARLAQLASVSVQKDKAAGYLSLLNDLLAAKRQSSADILKFVNVVVTQEHVGLVIGRQVISELVKALETKQIADENVRRQVIEGTLQVLQPRIVTYEEQVGS